jgi:hypothetical protein
MISLVVSRLRLAYSSAHIYLLYCVPNFIPFCPWDPSRFSLEVIFSRLSLCALYANATCRELTYLNPDELELDSARILAQVS